METYPQASCLWHGQMLQVCDQGFTYPPFFALVMLPFAPMPLWLRDFVWLRGDARRHDRCIQTVRIHRLQIARRAA